MEIRLDKFKPRPYQLDLIDALENKGYKKLLYVFPRRAGKDFTAFNLVIREAIRTIGTYAYCLPTFRQAKDVIWNTISVEGNKFLDYIPKELIKKINHSEMSITLINGSRIQLFGSNSYNTSLVGSNHRMVIFSEYALSDPNAYEFVRPILNANNGVVIVFGTPRGKNHFYDLYQIAKQNPKKWFSQLLTVEDTKHISLEAIQEEIESGEMSEDKALQEYWCSFLLGQEGAFYIKFIDKARLEDRIGFVSYQSNYPVHTAWDIGVSDSTAIIFFQVIRNVINIIDSYENNSFGLDHYVKVLNEKDYIYGKHIAPHDIKVREWAGGAVTRLAKARDLGIKFIVAPNLSISDGIEAVRTMLPRVSFNELRCKDLIKAIEFYHHEYDHINKRYKGSPVHDWSGHYCDALRYAAICLPKLKIGMTPEDIQENYRKGRLGYRSKSNSFF